MTFDCGSKKLRIPIASKTSKFVYCSSFTRQFYLKNWQRFQTLLPKGNIPDSPVAWKQPEKLAFNHPWKTGDFVTRNEPLNMTQHPDLVASSAELSRASDAVKQIFSFDFLGRKYAQKQIQKNMINSVRNHLYDDYSLEAKIAAYTAIIRNLNEHLETKPFDRPVRKYLNSLIFCRYHRLKELRQCDYKRFEWLLEKLNLSFQSRPEFHAPTREDSIRTLTDQYVEQYKQKKLSEYRECLDSEKQEFLKDKVASLVWMRKEEIDCGVETPSVTVEMIDDAEKQLEKHEEFLRNRVIIEDRSRNILTES